jgi:mono/diheme cytochrome c family protein
MRRLLLLSAVGLAAAALVWMWMTRSALPAAERGRRLAEAHGCFTCHGPAGRKGTPDPGRKEASVPTFAGDLMMYAKDAADVREWILDGSTSGKRASETWRARRDAAVLRMPAYRGALTDHQVDDLVAYVMMISDSPQPDDSLAMTGRERIAALGCEGCHGPGGRLAPPNPGSLKGYLPSWDSADFPELVRGEAEFREWVRNGVSERFRTNPAARFFLERARLKMPAYEKHLKPGDLEAMWAYVLWLRSPAAAPDSAEVTAF